jgi:hypothetical protein
MDEKTNDLDQADEEFFFLEVSDEALEAAAGIEGMGPHTASAIWPAQPCC